MAIFLDDKPAELGGSDLAQVLSSVRSHLASTGRMVVEVKRDGQCLVGDDLERAQSDSAAEGEWRLYTADTRDLARSTLEAMLSQLDQARQYQLEAADKLNEDQQEEAMQLIAQAIGIWQQTQQAVSHCVSLIGIDLTQLSVNDAPASSVVESLVDQLTAMRDAIVAGDTVNLADSLAYEWPHTADRWQKILDAIVEKIDEDHADA